MIHHLLLASLLTTVAAHGNITSPPARLPGPAMAAACGQPAVSAAMADPTNPLEDIPATGANCKLDLCRGATFDDNSAQIQTYAPGQQIQMTAIIPIPHEGPMNVSIVDAKTNTVLGPPLIQFASYADEKLAVLPANNTNFAVTMPDDPKIAAMCAQPGNCVMQWFWAGTAAKQTYESCVDFVLAPGMAEAAGTVDPSGLQVPGVASVVVKRSRRMFRA